MDEKIKRLIEWSKGNPQGPISIHIDPTNRCNLKCRFCWQRPHERLGWLDKEHELSEEKLLEIVKDAASLGVKNWLISGGGEPFVRLETTTKLMVKIKKYGMRGDIITNGTLLNKNYSKKIIEAGWDDMRFSLNAPSAKVHNFMVNKKGAFKKVVNNIKTIQKIKREVGSEKPKVGLNTVITSRNYSLFPELVEFLHELGGEILNTQTIILYDKVEEVWSLNDKQRKDSRKYLKEAKEKCEEYGIRNNLESYSHKDIITKTTKMDEIIKLGKKEVEEINTDNPFLNSFCYEPFYLVTIRADGTVGSCRLFGDEGDNIHKKSLKEIWYGEYFNKARETLLEGPQSFCSKCGSNEILEQSRIRKELLNYVNVKE